MALTQSTMLPLGTKLPIFRLKATTNEEVSLEDVKQVKAYLVMFICNHCPFVKHLKLQLAKFSQEYIARGIAMVAINSNDTIKYPEDNLENMAKEKKQFDYRFPYLLDEDQTVAKSFKAACTPEFYLFDSDKVLVYRGQFDDSRPSNQLPVTGSDLRQALEAVLNNQPVSSHQKPSIGCNIKWKSGNEPNYI